MKKQKKPRFDKLYRHIMLLFLIVLIPAVVLGIYSYIHTQRTALENARETVQRQLSNAVQEIDKQLEDISAMYQVLSNNTEVRALELGERANSTDTTRMRNAATLFSDLVLLSDILCEIALYTGADKVITVSGIYPADYYFGEYRTFAGYAQEDWDALLAGRSNMHRLPPTTLRAKTVSRYNSAEAIPVINGLTMSHGRGLLIFVVDTQQIIATVLKYIPYTEADISIEVGDGASIASGEVENSGDVLRVIYTSAQNGWVYTLDVSRLEITVTSQQVLSQVLLIIVSVLLFGMLLVLLVSRYIYQPLGSIQAMLSEEMRLQRDGRHGNSLELLEAQVSQLMESSSNNEAQVKDLARTYAGSVFLSQTMTENKASALEAIMTRHLGFSGGSYQSAALRLVDRTPAREEEALALLGHFFPVFSITFSEDTTLIVFETVTLHRRALVQTAVAELMRRMPGVVAGVAVGSEIADVRELHRSLNASLTMLQRIGAEDGGTLLFAEDFDIASQYVYTHKDEWMLIEALQRNESDKLHQQLDRILLHNYERLVSHQQIQRLFEQLRNTAYRYAQQENTPVPPHAYDDRTAPFEVARRELHTLYSLLLADTETRTQSVHTQLVRDADAYILDNYEQDIYLDTVADALGVSAKHLSRVYKQHRGMNLSDRICSVRVERAKVLLLGTDMTIQDVMRQTGFVSRATFLRSFKKYVNLSPSVYRNLHNPSGPDEIEDVEGEEV